MVLRTGIILLNQPSSVLSELIVSLSGAKNSKLVTEIIKKKKVLKIAAQCKNSIIILYDTA